MIETGFIVFLSLAVLAWRLPRKTKLWVLGHPLWIEVPFGIGAYMLHYGTFSGMMAAAVACIMCFGLVQFGKWAVGYTKDGKYHRGIIDWRR